MEDGRIEAAPGKVANKIEKAVIPVAGLGTRMLRRLSYSKGIARIHRPIIEHVVRGYLGQRGNHFVTRSGKRAVENHFDANYELEHRLDKKVKRRY